MQKNRHYRNYAVYKKDELLFIGTAKECAAHFKVSERTVVYWATPTCHKKSKYGINRKRECGGIKVAEKI